MKISNSIYFALIYFLPLSLLLISCEWDNDDINYIEVDKGDLKNLSIDLAGINPNELIEIPNNSFFIIAYLMMLLN